MNNSNNRVSELFQKYLSNWATDAEKQEFLDYVDDPLYKEQIQELLSNSFDNQIEITDLNEAGRTRVLNQIFKDEELPQIGQTRRYRLWPRIAAAAAIIIVAGAGLFYFNQKAVIVEQNQIVKNDIAPGKQGATLTLANGKKIKLSEATNGELAKEAGVRISKSADGKLVYEITGNTNDPDKINILSTAKGETYEVRLPDGSLVALNATSSLEYPANFTALKQRRVKLTGEAYFEITKDKAHPFIVQTDKQEVEVLGTHFNINSYTDEPVTATTLLEGSVKVSSNGNRQILKPGEQAILGQGNITIGEVNTSDVIAWKNGKFVFDDENIESIMRKLSRWYNVEVVYEGNIQDKGFTASISRFDNISKILNKLSYTQTVHFKIEGRRIVVMQ